MIKFSKQVPAVYPSASRDFQYLCWLIDIVLNSVKHNIDDIYDLPNNKTDSRLIELLALTLGFKVKRNYDQNQLRALVAALPRILKYKGTKAAVDMAGNALIAASGAAFGDFNSEVEAGELIVTLPIELVDISLFTDLLTYILPAGMTYRIRRVNEAATNENVQVGIANYLTANFVPDLTWDDDNDSITGLSSMFEVSASEPVFTNYRLNEQGYSDPTLPNIGLLNNTIIAAVDKPFGEFTSDYSENDVSIIDDKIKNEET